ncbi:hypothetical protein F511_45807 [Dorcoceras hygrometricum]|uniref:Uncharacterized protein n=1 Tax=Dorcoceras hygrometricum TaxID=472368 RepID=A0A2Z7A2I4_9LAMI|nr:hypothetical protein F511_45807 [Dorcoceras hygrometricum]
MARKLHGLPGIGPNQTLEEISRHDIAGASPERRPAGGRHHEFTCAARAHAAATSAAPSRAISIDVVRPVVEIEAQHGAASHDKRPAIVGQQRRNLGRSGSTTGDAIVQHAWRKASGDARAIAHPWRTAARWPHNHRATSVLGGRRCTTVRARRRPPIGDYVRPCALALAPSCARVAPPHAAVA